jgi:hypothetical protein
VTNSELQVCHYGLQRFVPMSGPARAIISTGSITVESGKAAVLSKEPLLYRARSRDQFAGDQARADGLAQADIVGE